MSQYLRSLKKYWLRRHEEKKRAMLWECKFVKRPVLFDVGIQRVDDDDGDDDKQIRTDMMFLAVKVFKQYKCRQHQQIRVV